MSDLISELGGPAAVARMVGVKPPSVIGWRGRPPPDRCPAIERATAARVTCEQLRPDVRWHRVPDAAWPHPDGRPCIDVAAPATQPAEARDAA
jgi:DNA-binding transcriptional regulator YdaS (Cro superfamily)